MSKSNSVRHELIANYAGRVWTVLANFLCLPLYVRWLGPESYGVVAFVTTIQSAATLFDFGFTTGISREVARHLALGSDSDRVRDFVRTLEVVYWLIGLALCAGMIVLAGPISTHWLMSRTVAPHLIRNSLLLGGIGILFTWPVTFYMGLMIGLNRQVAYNIVNMAGLTVRFGGTALVCWLIPHSLVSFFGAQAIAAGVSVLALAVAGWHFMPASSRAPVFRRGSMRGAGEFLTGMTLANAAALLFTQSDKILLSKLLPLEQFGYYTLAWTLVGIFYLFYSPASAVFLPRFSAMLALHDNVRATRTYHFSCQIVAIGAFPTAAVVSLFPYEVVASWTGNPALVQGTAPLVQILAPFSLIGCLGYMPSVFQWASGWTSITTKTYCLAFLLMIPTIYLGFVAGGAAGALLGWGIVRIAQTFVQVEFMHRKLLIGEKWRWYRDSILGPGAAAFSTVLAWRLITDHPFRCGIFFLALIWGTSVAAAFACSPLLRLRLLRGPATPGRPSEVVTSHAR